MLERIKSWLPYKWIIRNDAGERAVLQAYAATFASAEGNIVLQHLLDTVYCTIYEGSSEIELAYHNGKRAVVQGILENIDYASNPHKYIIAEPKENGNAVAR